MRLSDLHRRILTQPVGLLEVFPNALVAYSLMSLRRLTTNVVRVRRSSNNLQLDFTAKQIIDGTLSNWVGVGNNGLVTTIYDQGPGNFNMTQTNQTRQGVLVSNGIVNLLNGKPVILQNDNNTGYISSYQPNGGSSVKGMFFVGRNSGQSVILGGLSNADFAFVSQQNNTSSIVGNVNFSQNRINGLATNIINRNLFFNSTLNQFVLSTELVFNFESNALSLGYNFSNPLNFGMFAFQELVIFGDTDKQLAKEQEINSLYNTF